MSKRRAKGEGGIYERKDGRWAGQYDVETALGAKRRYVYAKTRKEAAEKLRKAIGEREAGLTFDAGRLTVGAFLDSWLNESVRDSVRQRTWDRYEQLCRVRIKPALGRIRLKVLTPAHLQRLYRQKLDEGLSPCTLQYIHAMLRRALGRAVKWGLVPRNVAEAADAPRPDRKEIKPLTPEQARTFLQAAQGDRYEARSTCIPRVAEGLRIHRERQRAAGVRSDTGLVFTTTKGTPVDAQNMTNRSFKPLLPRAGLPPIRFQDLRHSAATLMLTGGVHPKTSPRDHVDGCVAHSRYVNVTPLSQT